MQPRQSIASRRAHFVPDLQLGRKHKADYWLLIWCVVLLVIGLMVVYSISPALAASEGVSSGYYVTKQLIAIGLSAVAFIVTSQIPLKWWRQAYKPLLIAAGLITLVALALPVNPSYPAHRWIHVGGFSFQSVELVKFAGLIWLAGFLSVRIQKEEIASTNRTTKPILYALAVMGVVVAFLQSDLGSAGVIVAMTATMIYVAGVPLKRIFIVGGILSVGVMLAIVISPYRLARLQTYLHPTANCQGSGYQACQALIAVGSGGMAGLGLGGGVQAYGYVPEAANDSIFAIYAEKFGFIGAVALLGVFVAFISRLKSIAERSTDDFTRLIVVGIMAWLSVQTLINVGSMIGLFPLKGITLPFISYGGTSVVIAAAAVGLAYQASQYAAYNVPRDSNREERSVPSRAIRRADY